MTTSSQHHQIIVVGGGLAGLACAVSLAADGHQVLCLDAAPIPKRTQSRFDGRTTAVAYGPSRIFAQAGIWDTLEPLGCPIKNIDISDSGHGHLLDFFVEDSGKNDLPAMGWIFDNHELRRVLIEHLNSLPNAQHRSPVCVTGWQADEHAGTLHLADGSHLSAQLIIAADGKNSLLRDLAGIPSFGWGYRQTALVGNIIHEAPHENWALEHFYPDGPFAALPLPDDQDGQHRSAVVWTVKTRDAKRLLSLSLQQFDDQINDRLRGRYGNARTANRFHGWPLKLQQVRSYIAPRLVMMGEAARVMHPIAGQGLNVTMRDIAGLRDILSGAADTGAGQLLQRFQTKRRMDALLMMAATDKLNKLFSNRLPGVSHARRFGLKTINKLPAVKRFFVSQAMGMGGR